MNAEPCQSKDSSVMRLQKIAWFMLFLALTGCGSGEQAVAELPPTETLSPLITLTPRVTATPQISRTPLPTFTFTPSETPIPPTPSNTFTPTEIPPILGIISSLQSVNVRTGPSASSPAFEALDAGTRVEILGENPEGTWLNVELEDGRQGWVSAALVFIEASPTPFPSLTPSPDFTALALGTVLPTAVFGGGTVTATPPRSIVTVTPVSEVSATEETPVTAQPGSTVDLPVINTTAVFQTATALAGGVSLITPTPAQIGGSTATTDAPGSPVPTVPAGTGTVQNGVDVLAYCDNPVFARPAPTNLAAGSTIDVFWGWFAKTRDQLQQHRENAIYEVRVNGKLLTNWDQYASSVREESDGNYHIYWYVPSEPLPAGQNKITYSLTWRNQITDGYDVFGPGTNNLSETGSCTFTVR